MSDRHDPIAPHLSDYLDESLSRPETSRVEAHLETCAECRAVLRDLRAVKAAARELGERRPPRDLWPAIASELPPRGVAESSAAPMAPAARRTGSGARRRFSLTVPQLAAAAALIVTVTSTATWWASARPGGLEGGPVASGTSATGAASSVASREARVPDAVAHEISELEAVLDSGRAVLDPNTILVLERNLAVIERAIEDSQRALALDPGSEFLTSHLERAYERKLEYLRDVSRIVDFAG